MQSNHKTKLVALMSLLLISLSCKSQILPLNTALDNIPSGAHVKDLNNYRNEFTGIYVANHDGKEITLYITKEEDKIKKSTGKTYYLDALVIKYIVKNGSNIILQDTYNQNPLNIEFYSIWTKPYINTVDFLYSGTNCGVGWGSIDLKKINATQLQWRYRPEDTAVGEDCPSSADLNIYLPETDNLIFTKQ